jgi:hypothetical protein
VANVTFVVHAMYSFLEIKNQRNLMKHLHASGEVADTKYSAWKGKQKKIEW